MAHSDYTYIWQHPDWPTWQFDLTALALDLARVTRAQGHLAGRLADAGLMSKDSANLSALTNEVLKTSEIEGEQLNAESVRSSLARRLGVDIGAPAPIDRNVDGVVDMVLDATMRYEMPLSVERLCSWHAALFPTGFSGRTPINTAAWRSDADGPMQVVSGPYGRVKVHFEAPPAKKLKVEMRRFIAWFNAEQAMPPLIKAGLAHLWLVTLHPFDDGNGRIARAVGDMALARAENSAQRFYSLAAQIQRERKQYYEQLERTQKGSLDVTPWLRWFLGCLLRAVEGAEASVTQTLSKAHFWRQFGQTPMNARQIKMLNRLLDGFDGKLTSSKWALMAKCSADTALRDINELVACGALEKLDAGGRSTGYVVGAGSTNDY